MGGVIVVGNRELPDLPHLAALKTRVESLTLQPTDNQLRAMMRHVALRGHESEGRRLDAGECWETCSFMLKECRDLGRGLDMRMLMKAFADRLQ
jgi:hypothetical protein